MKYTTIENAEIVYETGKAAAIWINGGPAEGGRGVWIPLSQIHSDSTIWGTDEEWEAMEVGKPHRIIGNIIIPEWLAKKKKLIT